MKRKDFSKLKLNVQKDKEIYFEHEDYIAGVAPFLRGINSTMYINNSWKINKQTTSSNKYQFQEKGVTNEIKLAYALAEMKEYLKKSISEGNAIDLIISTLSLSWIIGMDHFNEIATLRASRMLWAKIAKTFAPNNLNSLALKIDCQIANSSLNEEDSFNNLTLTTVNTMAAGLGGTQSLNTTKTDSKNSTSSELPDILNYKTQQFIQEEIGITKTIDPWAGSTFVEKRTEEIANKTWELYIEIEELGGFTQAMKKGLLKTHIKHAGI